jgi:uracil-DNA glycosylase
MITDIEEKAKRILEDLRYDERLKQYIDPTLGIPQAYRGEGEIKLIVLGQDPTIRDAIKRQKIDMVLNLNKRGSAGNYLSRICLDLGIERKQNIYATNLFKNFFTSPPTGIEEVNMFQELLDYWLPLLVEELAEFKSVPVITLGEPVLKILLTEASQHPLREHWGYIIKWQGDLLFKEPKYVKPEANLLGRVLFPFPHQPSLRKGFYKQRMADYVDFVKANAFSL